MSIPKTTDLQIGDVLRFDGLQIKGKDRTDNRSNAWLTVDDISTSGDVRLRYAKTSLDDLRRGKVILPYDRLLALVEGGVYQIADGVGR